MKFTKILTICCALFAMACGRHEAQIITTAEKLTDGEWQCFHKEFFMFSPGSAELKIAADTKYWMWVNGELVVREGGLKRGPNPTDSYCDVFAEVPNLKFGKNEVVVLVQYYELSTFSHRASATPGLYFDLDSSLDHIVSDNSWKAIRYDAMYSPANEHNLQGFRKYRLSGANVGYDARKALDLSQHIDTESWGNAIAVSSNKSGWGALQERPIPQWRWSELRDYESVTKSEEGFLCKMPYNLHASPYIKLRARGGERIKMCTDNYWIGSARSFHAEYITREGVQEFEAPIWINGHDMLYFIPEGVEVLELKYRESGYDVDFVGSFECDDDFCNKIWEKAKRTLYVNMRDTYMDCPGRERSQWWGDIVIELGQSAYVFDERAHLLTRKGIYELMMHQREDGTIYSPIPGWYSRELPCQMLAAVGHYGFANYHMITGDTETIDAVYDRTKRYIFGVWKLTTADNVPTNSDLVEMRKGGWLWGDWGTNIDHNALQQCWYALALKGFAQQAHTIGRHTDALQAEQFYDRMIFSFNQCYWDEKLQHYHTPDYTEQPDDRVQAMAVLAGFVPKERYEAMRKFFKKHYQSSTYMEKYVLEALCKMGYYDDALERMEKRFGNMVAAKYTTLWEGWMYTGGRGMKYKSGHGTYNHAWSGGGLTILSQYIAGIAPVEPAFKRFAVQPNLSKLNYVKTTVPSRYGNIEMHAQKSNNELVINLTVPEDTTAEVRLPQGYNELVYGDKTGNTIVLQSGEHTVVAK